MRQLVLASTSPYRRQLLEQLAYPFVVAAPNFVEELTGGVAPRQLVQDLALGKALSLATAYPDALILGSDQLFVAADQRVLGKPGNFDQAFAQLRAMSGRRSLFHTGVALHDTRTGRSAVRCCDYAVTLRELSDGQIRSYLLREEPYDCAGSFRIEGLGIALMEAMDGNDYTTLIGLPLLAVSELLAGAGVDLLTENFIEH